MTDYLVILAAFAWLLLVFQGTTIVHDLWRSYRRRRRRLRVPRAAGLETDRVYLDNVIRLTEWRPYDHQAFPVDDGRGAPRA